MDKYLTYSVVERKDPQTPELEGRYYAQAQARGEAGIRELSQRIQQSCTVTRADVMAVLIELGSLQVSLRGKGAASPEEYHDGLIEKGKILFRSGETLSTMLGTLKFQKVEQKYKKEEEEPLP